MNSLKWKEGQPESAGSPGFFFVADEDGDFAIVELGMEGSYSKPRCLGPIVAYAGPIEEPDPETMP